MGPGGRPHTTLLCFLTETLSARFVLAFRYCHLKQSLTPLFCWYSNTLEQNTGGDYIYKFTANTRTDR